MSTLPANHLARIANFYSTKLKELRYFLRIIVDNCDESLRRANTPEANTDPTAGPVTFSFSAFTNTIQTLKDVTGKLAPEIMPWSKIRQLRHGEFMYLVRNAMTHDGDTVISLWIDGRYFVPSKIVREDQRGNVLEIIPPVEDVRQFCLEFVIDFMNLIVETLEDIPEDDRLSMSVFDIDELDEIYRNNKSIPEFALAMLTEQRSQIEDSIKGTKVPRIENAISLAKEIGKYCDENLVNVSEEKA